MFTICKLLLGEHLVNMNLILQQITKFVYAVVYPVAFAGKL